MENKTKFEDLIHQDRPVLVDFYASWCGPCQMMKPILQELATMMGDQVKVVKVDVEKNPQLARSLRIQGVPTLMLFQQGKVLWRQAGVMSARQLEHVIKTHAKETAM